MPHLVQVHKEFQERGGQVIGVSLDLFVPDVTPEQALEKVRAFAQKREIPFPMLVLNAETPDQLNERWELPGGIPVLLAFDAAGKEVDREESGADLERMRAMMRRALGEPAAK